MGAEVRCKATFGGKSSEGKALLETGELIFRGDFRLKIPFKDIQSLKAEDGALTVRFTGGTATFHLGPLTEKWAEKIRNPKSVLDKLGVKPGMRIAVIAVRDSGLEKQLNELRIQNAEIRRQNECDMVFFGAEKRTALKILGDLRKALKPNGALWVIRPKGSADISEADVMAAGKAAGLVDVKVVKFSDTHTAEKFVVPVSTREK